MDKLGINDSLTHDLTVPDLTEDDFTNSARRLSKSTYVNRGKSAKMADRSSKGEEIQFNEGSVLEEIKDRKTNHTQYFKNRSDQEFIDEQMSVTSTYENRLNTS